MAKKANLNPETIFFENYNNDYRDIVRLVALYGCFSGSDVDKGNIFPLLHREDGKSFIRKSAFSTKMKQLSYLLTDEYLSASNGGTKTYSIADDMFTNKNDYLHRTFKMHNFTQNQIMYFFILLQAASSYAEELELDYFSLNDLAVYIAGACEDNIDTISEPLKSVYEDIKSTDSGNKSKPFRAIFEKMVEAGYFVESNNEDIKEIKKEDTQNRSTFYELAEDKLSELEDITLDRLYRLLDHLSKTESIKIPYFLAKERLVTYALVSGRDSGNYIDKILFRHNHNYSVLDNEILYELLKAILTKKFIRITYKHTSQNYSEDDTYEQSQIVVYPIKIVNSNEDGRQFLFCSDNEKVLSIRLDYIVETETLHEGDKEVVDSAVEAAKNIENHVWSASAYNFGKELQTLCVKFVFGDNDYSFIQRLYIGSKRFGIEHEENSKEYSVNYAVYDPFEMIPWLQSFGKRVQIIENNDISREIKSILERNRKEMQKKYGVI